MDSKKVLTSPYLSHLKSADGQTMASSAPSRVPSTTAADEEGGELSGNGATITNIICAVIGAGILAVPKGLQSSGWSGLILLLTVAVLSIYSGTIIIKCMNYTSVDSRALLGATDGDASAGGDSSAGVGSDVSVGGGGGGGSGGANASLARAAQASLGSTAGDGENSENPGAGNDDGFSVVAGGEPIPRQSDGQRHDARSLSALGGAGPASFAVMAESARLTYGEIGEAAFGRPGRAAVNLCSHLTLLGPCIGYLVLAGSNLSLMLCNAVSVPAGVALCSLALWPHVLLPTLSDVTPLSVIEVVATLWLVVVVTFEALKQDQSADGLNPALKGTCTYEAFQPGGDELATTFLKTGLQWWYAFPAFAMSFACHAVLPSIYEEMREKQDYNVVLCSSFSATAGLYALIGVVGYYEYGECVQAPIYWNLEAGFGRLSAIVLVTVLVLLSFCVVGFASEKAFGGYLIDSVERRRGAELTPKSAKAVMLVGKSLVLAFCAVVGCVVPNFEGIFGLVGSLPVGAITFILPGAFHLKLFGRSLSPARRALDITMVVFGVLGAIFGTIASVIGLVEFFENPEEEALTYPDYCPSSTAGGW